MSESADQTTSSAGPTKARACESRPQSCPDCSARHDVALSASRAVEITAPTPGRADY
jgi:hypothetical protein